MVKLFNIWEILEQAMSSEENSELDFLIFLHHDSYPLLIFQNISSISSFIWKPKEMNAHTFYQYFVSFLAALHRKMLPFSIF